MSNVRGLFITGTDTGVGKTYITAMLALAFCQRGLRVGVMKPVETGCPIKCGQLQPQDSLFLRQIACCTAPQELVTPYSFREPVAPAVAAQQEGRKIDLGQIAACYEKLAAMYEVVLVEGAGGLLVPLTEHQTFLDLAVYLNLPLLIVARNVLGTINHTALTASVASQRCCVLGTILNTLDGKVQDESQASNAEALRRWGRAPLLGLISYIQEGTQENLLKQSERIDISTILTALHISVTKEVHL